MSESQLTLLGVAFCIAAIFVWIKMRKWRGPPHVHNWDYRGENCWSKSRKRMEYVEYCLAPKSCDQIIRFVPWEKKDYEGATGVRGSHEC